MIIDIDAIEARLKDEVTANGDELEFIGIYFSAEEARGLCSEVRELRATLARERMELVYASVSVSRARELTLAQEIRANNLSAALERARALAEKWADMKYNGDLTTAVYHGCAEELAAVLAARGGRRAE